VKRFIILWLVFSLLILGCVSNDDDDDDSLLQDDDDTISNDDTSDDDTIDDDDDFYYDDDDNDDDDDDSDDDDDDSTTGAGWTFVVYMAADNDLESFAFDDLSEMTSVGGSNEDVNIIIIFDGLADNDSAIYLAGDQELFEIESYNELNMGDGQTLKDTASYVFNNFPADRYALIFWNHGSGWHDDKNRGAVKWVCEDIASGGDVLGNDELDNALTYIRNNSPASSIDLIGFDACLMQMIEIAYYLKDDGKVLVGSQETEDGDGWEYNNFLNQLISNPNMTPDTLGSKIVSTYIAKPDATLSVLDLEQINNLSTAIDNLASELILVGGNSNASVMDAMFATLYFADWDYLDLYDFADKLIDQNINTAINSNADALKTSIDNTVIDNGYGFSEYSDSHGISIYFPETGNYDSDYNYLDFAADTDWDDVIN